MESVSKSVEDQLSLLLEEAEEELQQLEQDSLGYVRGVWQDYLDVAPFLGNSDIRWCFVEHERDDEKEREIRHAKLSLRNSARSAKNQTRARLPSLLVSTLFPVRPTGPFGVFRRQSIKLHPLL